MSANPSLTRRILALAVPALGALVAQPLFTLIDSAMVGHLGTAQLAGLSVASQVLMTAVVLFVFLAYSTTSLSARALGAGDEKRAVATGIDAMWLAAALGAGVATLVALLAPTLLAPLDPAPDVIPHALAYLRGAAPGLVGMFVTMAAVGTLRGLQDTRTPLYVTVAGAVLNVALNAALIYGLGWGVLGSAVGTSITQTLIAATVASVVARGARRLGVGLRPSRSGLWTAAIEGGPLMVRGLALRAAGLATLYPISHMGTSALAAYQVVLAVWTLTAFILDALAIAAQAMVGKARGAGDAAEMRTLLRTLSRWGLWAGIALALAVAATSPWLPRLFGTDPSMWTVATWALAASALGLPLCGVVFLLDGVLIGAGEGRYMAAASIAQLLVYLPFLALIEMLRRAELLAAWTPGGQAASTAATTESSVVEVATVGVAAVWLAYGIVYMGARLASNSWRTWLSPRYALVPRAAPPSSRASNVPKTSPKLAPTRTSRGDRPPTAH